MHSSCFTLLKRLFLVTAGLVTLTGCGSSGSSTGAPAGSGTGSLAATLVWSSPASAAATAKTVYSAPAGVNWVQIIVSAADMQGTVAESFAATAGTGTLSGIPAGRSRTVKVNGLDSGGNILYQGIKATDIVAGQTATLTIAMAPVTKATPAGGAYSSPQSVTLTASVPATIYYTTNGTDPTTTSPGGPSPLSGIAVAVNSILKFFATVDGVTLEEIKTESYHNP